MSNPTPQEVLTWTEEQVRVWCAVNDCELCRYGRPVAFHIQQRKAMCWQGVTCDTPGEALSEWIRIMGAPEREQALTRERDEWKRLASSLTTEGEQVLKERQALREALEAILDWPGHYFDSAPTEPDRHRVISYIEAIAREALNQ